ncbi:thioredoxin [Staphylotrichum tortipilum]|uniref:Thioredoxin n=1 Tax=Staphylotrichum tortipilum TaxID=2831512 RepID=A0AAN6MB39_9PEZI|nr:thioredoxin [Staphylotrichum longicolle]
MDKISYFWIALAIFLIIRKFFSERNPIPETSPKVHKITTPAELDTLLSSTRLVLVDFYADWCPPCRAIAPIFSALADGHAAPGKLAFAKVNVDHIDTAVSGKYGVTAMPTFVVFRDGQPGGVAVEGLKIRGRSSVLVGEGGKVERIKGADQEALVAVVRALVEEGGDGAPADRDAMVGLVKALAEEGKKGE